MTDTGVMCSRADVLMKCGANASATSMGETYTNFYISGAQAFINDFCHYNYTDAYAALNDDKRYLLNEVASDLAAIYVINYDMSGWETTLEVQNIIKVLQDRADRGLALLKEDAVRKFILEP